MLSPSWTAAVLESRHYLGEEEALATIAPVAAPPSRVPPLCHLCCVFQVQELAGIYNNKNTVINLLYANREDRELDEASPLAANYRAMLEVKEKEIEQLRSQAEASDRQLKIQTKVSSSLLNHIDI